MIFFHAFTKLYAIQAGFIKVDNSFWLKMNAERCAVSGLLITLAGVSLSVAAVVLWGRESFGGLNPDAFMRLTIPAVTLIVVGVQLLFSGFFIEILKIDKK